jgi:hypothetical protein
MKSDQKEENMKVKPVCLSLLALVFAMSPSLYAAPPQDADSAPLFFEVGPGDWRSVDTTTLVSKARGSAPGRVVPFLFFDENGQITLTQMAVEGGGMESLFAGECNGGQCAAGGVALSCPTSGGPTCGSGESCYCTCDGGGGSTSTRNVCRGSGGGGDEEIEMQ